MPTQPGEMDRKVTSGTAVLKIDEIERRLTGSVRNHAPLCHRDGEICGAKLAADVDDLGIC